MRYVEGWGSRFLRVNEELSECGAKPAVIDDAGIATRLNVYRTSSHAHEGNEGGCEGNESNHEPYEPNDPNRESNESKDTAQIIFTTFAENPVAPIPKLMDACHVSRATIKRALKTLKDTGRIRRNGGTRGVWEVFV